MSFLNYDDGLYKYQLTFNAPLNVITGDSSTGKTALVREVSRHKNSLTSDMSIIFNPSLDVFETAKENSMLILDSDDYEDSSSVELFKAISKSQRNDLVIVVLGRKYLNLLPLSPQNMFRLEVIEGITKNVPIYPKLCTQSTAPF